MVRIAINLNLFTILVNSDEPKTGKELAKITGVDHLLLLRLLRYLASVNAISEEGIDVYAANNVSKSMATPNLAAGVKHTFDTNGFAYMALPKFLEQTKYQNPTSSTNSAFHLAFNTKEPLWEWFPSHPEYHESFNLWMSGQREGRANWLDFFPLEQRLSKGFNMINDEVMLVDVGGGFGHEIQAIKEKFPHVPGRMILQDLPSTIAKALSVKGMETMAYDFFTPQPIKGMFRSPCAPHTQ